LRLVPVIFFLFSLYIHREKINRQTNREIER